MEVAIANCGVSERTEKGKQVWNAWVEGEITAGGNWMCILTCSGMTSLRGRVCCGCARGEGELQTLSV
jgi:hypothetical protein